MENDSVASQQQVIAPSSSSSSSFSCPIPSLSSSISHPQQHIAELHAIIQQLKLERDGFEEKTKQMERIASEVMNELNESKSKVCASLLVCIVFIQDISSFFFLLLLLLSMFIYFRLFAFFLTAV
jgi:hypothetical protein